ncbi:MAG: LysE family translocator [Bacteroidota bacterium]
MELELILSFIGASMLLTFMPGPDNIFVLTESITKGHKHGIAISLGLVSGVMVHTLAAATGLSIILKQSDYAFQIVKYLGAAYLLYLAYMAYKEKKPEVEIGGEVDNAEFNLWKLMRKGFFMNVLNPKVSLFFIAFLPQFISKSGFNITLQMFILGLIFMIQAILIFTLISTLSGKFSSYLNSEKFWKYTKWGKVSVLVALGVMLALSEK